MKRFSLPPIDPLTAHAVAYSIIAGIVIITTVLLLLPQRFWPVVSTNDLSFPHTPQNIQTNQPTYPQPTYEEALDTYQGKRIQITNCTAHPTTLTVKNKSLLMLDSKSPDPQRVSIAGHTVMLNGFDFTVVPITATSLPETVSMECETVGIKKYNIVQILVQE